MERGAEGMGEAEEAKDGQTCSCQTKEEAISQEEEQEGGQSEATFNTSTLLPECA